MTGRAARHLPDARDAGPSEAAAGHAPIRRLEPWRSVLARASPASAARSGRTDLYISILRWEGASDLLRATTSFDLSLLHFSGMSLNREMHLHARKRHR